MQLLVFGDVFANDLGRGDAKEISGLTGKGAFDDDNVEFIIDLHDLELSDLSLGVPHLSRHFLSGVDTSGSRSSTDGSELPVTLGTVTHRASLEVVPLDST